MRRPWWKTLLAFAIIYFVWGSTFLAIRVGVREVPPDHYHHHVVAADGQSLLRPGQHPGVSRRNISKQRRLPLFARPLESSWLVK